MTGDNLTSVLFLVLTFCPSLLACQPEKEFPSSSDSSLQSMKEELQSTQEEMQSKMEEIESEIQQIYEENSQS